MHSDPIRILNVEIALTQSQCNASHNYDKGRSNTKIMNADYIPTLTSVRPTFHASPFCYASSYTVYPPPRQVLLLSVHQKCDCTRLWKMSIFRMFDGVRNQMLRSYTHCRCTAQNIEITMQRKVRLNNCDFSICDLPRSLENPKFIFRIYNIFLLLLKLLCRRKFAKYCFTNGASLMAVGLA